jgi:predicted transglutaminase-like cysteine proteinase
MHRPALASATNRPFGGLRVGVVRRGLCIAVLVSVSTVLLAWDPQRMQQAAQRQGPRAVASVNLLLPLLQEVSPLDELARLERINEFYNRHVLFSDDGVVWGTHDHWASPLETLARGAGDCEDYAIGKYFTLLAAGVPGVRLRLVYVRALIGGPGGLLTPHMVLAYHATPGAEPLILDNLISEVRTASRRPDLQPVFSFNAEGLWPGTETISSGNPADRLSRWRDVLAKARAEGFV